MAKKKPTAADDFSDLDLSPAAVRILTNGRARLTAVERDALAMLARQVVSNVVDLMHQRYDATHNPLYVWRAYQLSRAWDEAPPWISEYFDACAKRLMALVPSKDFERDITRACGFKPKGPKSFVSRYKDDSRKADAVMQFATLRQRHPKKALADLYADVAEKIHVDERTVGRWVKELQKFI